MNTNTDNFNLYLHAIESELFYLKRLGYNNQRIKKIIVDKFRRRFGLGNQTKSFVKAYEFVCKNKQIGNVKFCKMEKIV